MKSNTGFIRDLGHNKVKVYIEYHPRDGKRTFKTKTVKKSLGNTTLITMNNQRDKFIRDGGWKTLKDKLTFKAAAETYKAKCKKKVQLGTLKERTYNTYVIMVDSLSDTFGLRNIEDITTDNYNSFFQEDIITRQYSPQTVVKKRVLLYGIYKANKLDTKVLENTDPITSKRNHKKNSKVNPLTQEEMLKVDEYLKGLLGKFKGNKYRPWLIYYIYYFTLFTGLREGEVVGLKWSSIHMEDNYMIVNNNIVSLKGKGLVEDTTKSEDSDRILEVSEDTIKVLKELYETYKLFKYPKSDFVFITRTGKPWSPRNILRSWQSVCEYAGLSQHHTFHDLRHTNITLKIAAGIDVKTVSIMAGTLTLRPPLMSIVTTGN